jgi:O-antigen/teichoic acid export membrane protein
MTSTATETVDSGGQGSQLSVLRRMAVYGLSSVVPAVLTLATSAIFTRIFSTTEFGTYSLFLVVAGQVKVVLNTWISQSVGKYLPPERTAQGRHKMKDAILVSGAMIFICESVLGLVALSMSGLVMSSDDQAYLVPVIAFVLVTSAFELLGTVLATEQRATEYTRYKLIDSALTFALRLLMVSAMWGLGLTSLFWSVVLSNSVLVPVLWVRAGLPSPARFLGLSRSGETRALVRAFLVFGLPMTVWYFSGVLLDVGDRFVIRYFLGPAQVGIYDASYRLIAGVAVLMLAPVTMTLHPYLMSVAGSGDIDRVCEVIGSIVEHLILIGALAVGLTFLFREDAGNVLLGPEFRGGSMVMPIALAGMAFNNVGLFVHKPFEIIGRTLPMVVLGLVAAGANIAFNIVFVPWVGYLGAAYATLLSYVLYSVGVGVWGRRIFPWRINLGRVSSYLLVTVLGVVAIDCLREVLGDLPYWWNLAAGLVASCLLAAWCLVGMFRGKPVTRACAR